LPKAAHALDAQEPTGPEAQLLRIYVEGVLGQTEVPRDLVLSAACHDLGELQQVDVQDHTSLAECIPQPPSYR